ncbi:hypothetical protein ABTX35_13685 [Streptomyces sp. NPDC096080]|uniref:hypothetical protein n=1 Tax=Streptomyces sp. NPDC096080 TaxID=3156693 RepID=UPI003318553B
MVTPEALGASDLDTLVAALATGREMVVLAPNGTVNTGLVTGDQRQIVAAPAPAPAGPPLRQGPVRPKDLQRSRRRFVPPPGFGEALTALDSGVSVLLGAPGTGRETHALNLLAHRHEVSVLEQVDGTVDLARWTPRKRGVLGYLVMDPADPFALRSWDLSRLEATLAEAGARLLMVLADAPGLATAVRSHLGTPVVRHLPPDPRKVFAAHLADLCPHPGTRTRALRVMGTRLSEEVLHAGLPPRHAARAAETVARLATQDGASATGVLNALSRAEAVDLLAQAREDPPLLAHLLSLGVYGGLDSDVVVARADDLLELISGREQEPAVRRTPHPVGTSPHGPLPGILRVLGAHRTRQADAAAPETLAFFWPTVGRALWDVLCSDHADFLPALHVWLAGAEDMPDQVESAGRAVAAMATATGGRTLVHLRRLALTHRPAAAAVAARCLGTTAQGPAPIAGARDVLDRWSVADEPALRRAVAYACRPDFGRLTVGQVLRLSHRIVHTPGADAVAAELVTDVLVRRFAAGDSGARQALLDGLEEWTGDDGAAGLVAARAFPGMAGTDLAWWSDRIGSDATAAAVVQLTGHALNTSAAYPPMRDALFAWSRAVEDAPRIGPALEHLFQGLADARQPGFLRWLLAVERAPDLLFVKDAAPRLLTALRTKPPGSTTR